MSPTAPTQRKYKENDLTCLSSKTKLRSESDKDLPELESQHLRSFVGNVKKQSHEKLKHLQAKVKPHRHRGLKTLMAKMQLAKLSEGSKDKNAKYAFPVVHGFDQQGQLFAHYEGLDMNDLTCLRKAVTLYGPQPPYVKEVLLGVDANYNSI